MKNLLLVNADSLKLPLADQSVHTVITSPPYFGLRTYQGTSVWVGGDEECDHEAARKKTRFDYPLSEKQHSNAGSDLRIYKSYCPDCGATRVDKQIGAEPTTEKYINNMLIVCREIWRVLRDDGTFWLNTADPYNGSGGAGGDYNPGGLKAGQPKYPGRKDPNFKMKDLIPISWMLAIALQKEGWYLRRDVVWHKPNGMPENVDDRPTKAHEFVFLLTKNQNYYYDADAIREPHKYLESDSRRRDFNDPSGTQDKHLDKEKVGKTRHGRARADDYHEGGKNKRDVWTIPTYNYRGQHFATFPPKLVEPCIRAGTSEQGCCPVCGKQWKRITEVEYSNWVNGNSNGRYKGNIPADRKIFSSGKRAEKSVITLGWQPDCTHEVDPIPTTVLDPFVGSGTTLVVARQLNRNAIGTDVSFDYLKDEAKERLMINKLDEWQNGVNGDTDLSDLPMFGG